VLLQHGGLGRGASRDPFHAEGALAFGFDLAGVSTPRAGACNPGTDSLPAPRLEKTTGLRSVPRIPRRRSIAPLSPRGRSRTRGLIARGSDLRSGSGLCRLRSRSLGSAGSRARRKAGGYRMESQRGHPLELRRWIWTRVKVAPRRA
jgi:hypothetical protein